MATPIPRNQAAFDLEAVVRATGGELRAPSSSPLRGVAIDSRAVAPGALFVAIRGEHHDGHRFATDAVEAGAGALLVARDSTSPLPDQVGVVAVSDTERALGDLAALHRRRWGGKVVGITGSAGKTTTKELVAAALSAAGLRTARTSGNLNNAIGVPMTLFTLDDAAEVAVVEMGTSSPGEISRLAEIARPDVGVVTLVAAAHTEGLGSVDAVAREKAALLAALHAEGTAVVNGDDGALSRLAAELAPERRLYFGRDPGGHVRLLEQAVDDQLRTRCVFALRDRDAPLVVLMRLLGEAAALNAAAALSVVIALGLDVESAARGLEGVEPTPGRMNPLRAAGRWILDDTYNANPRSTALALDTAAAVAASVGGRVVAVLGDMRELGARSGSEHAAIGRHAARSGVGALFLCGSEMAAAEAAARELCPDLEVQRRPDAAALVAPLLEALEAGDVVLVKGSRSLAMERVVDALTAGGAS